MCCYAVDGSSMLHRDRMGLTEEMRPRCDSLPDQSAAVGSKRKSILKKDALNREETERLLSGSGAVGAGSSRNSCAATPLDATPAQTRTRTVVDASADNEVMIAADDYDDDQLVVRHLPRLSDSSTDHQRRHAAQLPSSQSIATIAEFDTDCDEESSVEGELDSVRKVPDSGTGRPKTDIVSRGPAASEHPHESPKYPYLPVAAGACGGETEAPLDNIRSPQNANAPPPTQPTDINLNPPLSGPPGSAGVPPPIPARLQASDNLGNHLLHVPAPLDQSDTTAFTHNLFPTLDFIDEFAD